MTGSGTTHASSRWLGLHAGFAVAVAGVLLVPFADTGMRVLGLVIGYNLAVPVVARRTGDAALWNAWTVLAPMSVLMVMPDWFLSAVLGSITFPDTGAPFVGAIPVFMAGMWTIALLPVTMIGHAVETRRGASVAFTAVGAAGLLMFTIAERLAPTLPLWKPLAVEQIGGVAIYVVLPEVALCVASYALVRGAPRRPVVATAGGIVAIPFMYLGMLASAYQFLG